MTSLCKLRARVVKIVLPLITTFMNISHNKPIEEGGWGTQQWTPTAQYNLSCFVTTTTRLKGVQLFQWFPFHLQIYKLGTQKGLQTIFAHAWASMALFHSNKWSRALKPYFTSLTPHNIQYDAGITCTVVSVGCMYCLACKIAWNQVESSWDGPLTEWNTHTHTKVPYCGPIATKLGILFRTGHCNT